MGLSKGKVEGVEEVEEGEEVRDGEGGKVKSNK